MGPVQVRAAEVSIRLVAAVPLAGARIPEAAHSPEAAHIREAVDNKPPPAHTCGHRDQDDSRVGKGGAQPLQEARLQAHLERNYHKAHDEIQGRSPRPRELHPPARSAQRMESSSQTVRHQMPTARRPYLAPCFVLRLVVDHDLYVSADLDQ